MSVRADVLRGAGGFTSDLGRRKLGFSVTGTAFTVDGKPFFVTGVNNHYLTFGSRDEVTRVLDDAVAMDANVVRTFLQPTIGSLDGSVATIWNWRNGADVMNEG